MSLFNFRKIVLNFFFPIFKIFSDSRLIESFIFHWEDWVAVCGFDWLIDWFGKYFAKNFIITIPLQVRRRGGGPLNLQCFYFWVLCLRILFELKVSLICMWFFSSFLHRESRIDSGSAGGSAKNVGRTAADAGPGRGDDAVPAIDCAGRCGSGSADFNGCAAGTSFPRQPIPTGTPDDHGLAGRRL